MPHPQRSSIAEGLRPSLPVMLGYLPVAFAFGILAVQAGMTPLSVGFMSYAVYAGSAQLIAVGMMGAGVGAASIILTTFVVNLRHLLMSAAVAPHLRAWSKGRQMWFAFGLTDETFAVHMSLFAKGPARPVPVLALNTAAHLCWTAGSVAGALFGDLIGDVKPYGLDFALPGMFLALLLPHVRVPRKCLALCLGALFALTAKQLGAGQWSVMAATPPAAFLAAFMPLPGNAPKEPA